MNSSRAMRRAQRERMQQRARRIVSRWSCGLNARLDDEMQIWAQRNAEHLKNCSCWMCGHQRKWHGATRQERRSLLALRDE